MYEAKGYDAQYGDWYWVKYNLDGSVARTPREKGGQPIRGLFASCIQCHDSAAGDDFVFTNDQQLPVRQIPWCRFLQHANVPTLLNSRCERKDSIDVPILDVRMRFAAGQLGHRRLLPARRILPARWNYRSLCLRLHVSPFCCTVLRPARTCRSPWRRP
jgi:hypothetical protein